MNTYAHIETGRAIDVIPAPDLATYRRILNAPNGWQIIIVPDGTVSGSTQNQDGGWDAPQAIAAALQPVKMSGKEFSTYCAATLAAVNHIGAQQGLLRFDQIVGAMLASTAPLMSLAKTSYQAAIASGGRFTLDDVTTLLQALAASGAQNAPTAPEVGALISNWPQG